MPGTPGRSGGNRTLGVDCLPPDGLPDAPEGHSDAFYGYWRFLIENLPHDSLRKVDALQMAILCEQLVEIDDLTAAIQDNPADLKARSLRLRISQQVSRLSAQFGLSPADRMRLKVEPKQVEDDPFSELLERMQTR